MSLSLTLKLVIYWMNGHKKKKKKNTELEEGVMSG